MNAIDRLKGLWEESTPQVRQRAGIVAIILLLIAVCLSAINAQIANLEKKRVARERDLAEMLVLKQKLVTSRTTAQAFANRLAATRPEDSPTRIIEETGIKGKGIKVSPLKPEQAGDYMLEMAEVRVEGVTANEAVNLLYRIEKGARPVVVKKASIKTRFDDQGRLDLVLTMGLVKGSPER